MGNHSRDGRDDPTAINLSLDIQGDFTSGIRYPKRFYIGYTVSKEVLHRVYGIQGGFTSGIRYPKRFYIRYSVYPKRFYIGYTVYLH